MEWGLAGIAILAVIYGVYRFVMADRKELRARNEAELKALGATNEQLAEINKAQANAFPDAKSANNWLRSRNKSK